MLKKLKNLLTNNIGLKFLSVLFAMILWLVVVNIDDPDKKCDRRYGKKLFHYQ